jgi:hypothetical protein
MMVMPKIVRYIDDIPIDVYTQIPAIIANYYKHTLSDLSKYINKLITNEIKPPFDGSILKFRTYFGTYNIYKSENDPFDIEYLIMCKIKTLKLNDVISEFLKKENLKFDIHTFIDKNILLRDIAKEFDYILNKKISIIYGSSYSKMIVHIFFNAEDKIITI